MFFHFFSRNCIFVCAAKEGELNEGEVRTEVRHPRAGEVRKKNLAERLQPLLTRSCHAHPDELLVP